MAVAHYGKRKLPEGTMPQVTDRGIAGKPGNVHKKIAWRLRQALEAIVQRQGPAIAEELRAKLYSVATKTEGADREKELSALLTECERVVDALPWMLRGPCEPPADAQGSDAFPILGSLGLDPGCRLSCGTVYRAHTLLRTAVMAHTLPSLPEATKPEDSYWGRRALYDAIDQLTGVSACQIIDTIEKRLNEQRNELALFVRKTMTAHEEERSRVAANVHDVLSQAVSAALFRVQAARGRAQAGAWDADEDLAAAESALEHCLAEMRRIVLDLRPPVLDRYGLVEAVREHASRYQKEHGVAVNLTDGVYERERLSPEEETALFRIVQEAMTNAARHARATQVTIRINATSDEVGVEIVDNGIGFDTSALRPGKADGRHFGLLGMRERAQLLGSELEIRSIRNTGTTVRVCVPRRG
jgi:signal transduction histidine kinase